MNWDEFINQERELLYFYNLEKFILEERKTKTIFPKEEDVFNAFKLTPFENVKCVIVGQDPYYNINQANGLAFSVNKGIKLPPSLVNIYKEAHDDIGIDIPNHGDLSSWAKEGVFLLNTILTVEEGKPLSYKNKGWEKFTLKVLKTLNDDESPKVFILWGKEAINLKKILNNPRHLILESAHPSPLSSYRGFFGSKPFSKTNEFLIKNNRTPINFEIK
jgi:uracil-DNA glycosylase